MRAPRPLFSPLDPLDSLLSPAYSGGFLAVALTTEDSAFPRARLLRLVTGEARVLDPRALVQRESAAVVALLALARPLEAAERLDVAEALRQRVATATGAIISAGVSAAEAAGDARQIGRACSLAQSALAAGRRALGPGRTADLRSLGSQAIFGLLADSPELRLFCQDLLEPLLEYDRRRRGRLLPTLAAYFDARLQPAGAAERLGEHRNTILYRLALIERLTGRSLRDPDEALCFMLSVKTLALEGAPAETPPSPRRQAGGAGWP